MEKKEQKFTLNAAIENLDRLSAIGKSLTSEPSEQKPPEQQTATAEEIWERIGSTGKYRDAIDAMQEYANQERQRARQEAIQECIEALSKYWVAKNDGLDPMFNELEKLKR